MTTHGTNAGTHAAEVHVVPFRVLAGVLAALLVLTWVTVAATWFEWGELNLWIALGIATVKATLVLLYFMHLKYEAPLNALVLVAAILFVVLFVGLALMDTEAYQPDLIPGYAPGMPSAASAVPAPGTAAPATTPAAPGTAPAAPAPASPPSPEHAPPAK